MTFSVLAILYLGAALGVGAVVWSHTRETWLVGSLSAHVARCVLLTVVAGAFWPGTALLAVAYQVPAGRDAIDRFVSSPPDGGPAGPER
jgi:hypothetical protein